jgi:bifunctional oligoribonuclease and PAP phosphatase NrnA
MTNQPTPHQNPKQEIAEKLRGAKSVLVVSHQGPDADAVGSVLALSRVLGKLGKEVTPLLADDVSEFHWLPGAGEVQAQYRGGRTLKVQIRAPKEQIDSLRYETEPGGLSIIIEPKDEPIRPEAVHVEGPATDFDALVVLDTPAWNYVGEIGLELPGDRPVLVIDHHPTSEKFGSVNWVDSSAASTSEMLLSLIESLGPDLIDAEVATCLYAGLLGDTGGFQNSNTRGGTLSVAAQLVSAGADHPKLVNALLQPSLDPSSLRIWGHALANLRTEPELGLAWSTVSQADILEAGNPEHWGPSLLMGSLLRRVEGARAVLLLTEPEPGIVQASLRVPPSASDKPDVAAFAQSRGGGGHREAAGFRLEQTNLMDVIGEVLPALREYLQSGKLTEAQREQPAQTSPVVPKSSSPEEAIPASAAEHTAPIQPRPEPRVWQPERQE